ncbi:MAG: hypothetical protein AMJ91_02975 [candidate division Zixibacteria bacterium SM23_73_3]|nr:MAG: hypothetical protein AMJ91_02975 [candidate division Zixibacteria bacterium SM23_73_3]
MNVQIVIAFIAFLISALAGGVASTDVIRRLLLKLLGKEPPRKTYAERLSNLTSSLAKASGEVDTLLHEMTRVARERQQAVKNLEVGLADLEKREKELKGNIEVLEKVPIPVAEHFARLVEPSQKRSTRRDYMLFISGVLVTTIVAVVLQLTLGK